MITGGTKKLFADIAPRFSSRAGGYTRIIHAGFRIGDGADLAILELLGSKLKKKEKKDKAAKPEAVEEEPTEEKAGAEQINKSKVSAQDPLQSFGTRLLLYFLHWSR